MFLLHHDLKLKLQVRNSRNLMIINHLFYEPVKEHCWISQIILICDEE